VPDELDEIRQRLDSLEGRLNSEIPQRLDSLEGRLNSEIPQRLDSLEGRMNSEASLRAMMDLDQARLTVRFDAQDNLLRALAVTQSEHTARLRRLEEGHRRLEEGHGRLEQAVTRVETGIQAILGLLREDH
jgi:tetrahydromethanopterin S-methyltransferase subunit G